MEEVPQAAAALSIARDQEHLPGRQRSVDLQLFENFTLLRQLPVNVISLSDRILGPRRSMIDFGRQLNLDAALR